MPIRKKEPSDYPSMSFRVTSHAEKEKIANLIEQIYENANKKAGEGKRLVKKNEIITEAILKGLKDLKRKYR